MKEKDSHIEEVKKLLSEKLEIVSSLEKDLANVRSELTERDRRINDMLQAEVNSNFLLQYQMSMTFHALDDVYSSDG